MAFHDSFITLELVKTKKSNSAQQPSSLVLSEYWDFACRALIFATAQSSRQLSSTFTLVHRCAAIVDCGLLSRVTAGQGHRMPNDEDDVGDVARLCWTIKVCYN